MSRLLLIRHAQSVWNAEGRWQGWSDPPLSTEGVLRAQSTGPQLAGLGIDEVVSSDLLRARTTAEILVDKMGSDLTIGLDHRLRERNLGEWSGLTTDEIEQRWPGSLADWTAAPGGETTAELTSRVQGSLAELGESAPERTVLVVTHGGAIRAIETALGLSQRPIHNLAGRWIGFGPQGMYPLEAFDASSGVPATPARPGDPPEDTGG
jgi:broad specificity phosphatase PhoE